MKQTLTAGLLLLAVGAAPAQALESPYLPLAQAGGGPLVLKEDPAKDPVLLELLGKFNKKTALEKLPILTISQRERIMGYYKLARSQPDISDRTVANGVSGMVLGYVEIDDVRRFVDEYAKTGKLPKGLPLPYANFKGASEKFPWAEIYLANELSSTKKLDEQIGVILDTVIADADRRSEEADRRSEEARRQGEDARKSIELLKQLLKAVK
ncbi:hypothetical protein GBK02_05700 [Dechloromonas sp. TW-R-39-2]|uniref:hypothetical protein n=1 Tax=Dechloromonas sp. TW-R-39-2 TaxID=2654218 RepID=UPI00193CC0A9|nr:hypothetical protein [Dechloromonas sp. TW-R-39-2]QRM18920.1 hypothetical protein GBK02_05700 [Dechloromonas sp. TW-R-39-2]